MRLLSAILIFVAIAANAQSEFLLNSENLGPIYAGDQRFADFEVTNFSYDPVFLLRVENSRNVSVVYDRKKLLPDSSAIIRAQFNPAKTGKFREKILVYMSDHKGPITLTLQGQVHTIEMNQSQACPDFSVSVAPITPQAQLAISVLDNETNQPIPNVKVTLLSAGVNNKDIKTVVDGSQGQNTPIGLYKISAAAKGYYSSSQIAYIGVKVSHLTMYLDREGQEAEEEIVEEIPEIKQVIVEEQETKEEPIEVAKEKSASPKRQVRIPKTRVKTRKSSSLKEEKFEEPQEDVMAAVVAEPEILIIEEKKPTPEKPKNESSFIPESEFKPNNIVFLIDISTSMTHLNKLELLKLAIIRLSKQLRPIDKMSIVTYDSNTEVLLEPTPANQAQKIADLILPLEAKGRTAGGKGITKAYEVLNSAYIDDGNNEVLLATDGVFNVETQDKEYLKLIKKNAKQGSRITVIGVKNKAWTAASMQYISDKGKGHYIHIEDEEDTHDLLLHELKTNSRREP